MFISVRAVPVYSVGAPVPEWSMLLDLPQKGLKLLRQQQAASTCRLVPSPELEKELARGALRFATPGSGDASTLI
jgi:hypothetical protein